MCAGEFCLGLIDCILCVCVCVWESERDIERERARAGAHTMHTCASTALCVCDPWANPPCAIESFCINNGLDNYINLNLLGLLLLCYLWHAASSVCVQSAPPEVPLSLISLLLTPFTHTLHLIPLAFPEKPPFFIIALFFCLSNLPKKYSIYFCRVSCLVTHTLSVLVPVFFFYILSFSPPHSGCLFNHRLLFTFYSFSIFCTALDPMTQQPLPLFQCEKGSKFLSHSL